MGHYRVILKCSVLGARWRLLGRLPVEWSDPIYITGGQAQTSRRQSACEKCGMKKSTWEMVLCLQ